MNEQKRQEIWAGVWLFIAGFTFLALSTYTSGDIAYEVSAPNTPIKNFGGISGAYLAWTLLILFGRTAYFLVPLFLFWALAKWSGKKSQALWVKIFSTSVFLISACALFSLFGELTEINRFHAGGIIGFFSSSILKSLFGNAGIYVALSLFLFSIILATELLLLQMTQAVVHKIKDRLLIQNLKAEAKEKAIKEKIQKAAPEIRIDEASRPAARILPDKKELKAKERSEVPVKQAPLPEKPTIKLSAPPKQVEKPEVVAPLQSEDRGDYRMPSIDMLEVAPNIDQSKMKGDLEASSKILEDTLRDFGIEAKVVEVEQGPTITRYELQPAAGVKVGRITSLENDISLAMRATSVRIVAPIPGKSRVGIEVPNSAASTVYIRDVFLSHEFQKEPSKITLALGKDTAGAPIVCNLADMPHLLIAGATNTGKSVCINSIIMSILYKASPEEVKFILIDPKMVELHFYNDLPHLICPVVTEKAKTPAALAWLVAEMERRYRLLSKVGAKNILSFNEKVEKKEIRPELLKVTEDNADEPIIVKKMPYILIVIDELADLMLASAQEVETAITRLAQLARAVGIHMILATQRPSVDVITGVIKANFPARIAFQVASKVDSRTILDENGADKLLGRGDMLLMDPRKSKVIRAQGAWVQDKEIERVTNFIRSQRKAVYHDAVTQTQEKKAGPGGADAKRDEMYEAAKKIVLDTKNASVSSLQRRLGLGYSRAARMIDMLEEDGIVGPFRGAKPREILVDTPNPAPEMEAEEKENV